MPARDSKGRFVSKAGNAAGGITWSDNTLLANIEGFDAKLNDLMGAAVEFHASSAEAWAKANAPWNDQTSNARNGLRAVAVHDNANMTHAIIVHHSVDYGIWLEVRWNGRYAIIEPTIQHEGAELMLTVAGLLKAMG